MSAPTPPLDEQMVVALNEHFPLAGGYVECQREGFTRCWQVIVVPLRVENKQLGAELVKVAFERGLEQATSEALRTELATIKAAVRECIRRWDPLALRTDAEVALRALVKDE